MRYSLLPIGLIFVLALTTSVIAAPLPKPTAPPSPRQDHGSRTSSDSHIVVSNLRLKLQENVDSPRMLFPVCPWLDAQPKTVV